MKDFIDFIKNNKKTILNTLIVVVFFLPVVVSLYLVLFNFTFNANQANSLLLMFCVGLTLLPIANMPKI